MDPFKIKNINFSIIDEDDDRWDELKQQRLERGFDESELWNLDHTISRFILPRLKAFKDENITYPILMTKLDWEEKLNKMILAFENIIDEDLTDDYGEREKIMNEGLDLFRKHFFNLWY